MTQQMRITPNGLKVAVQMVMSGEAGEFVVEPAREGSLLALAIRIADRCRAVCEAEELEMSDEVYLRALDELAPAWAASTAEEGMD